MNDRTYNIVMACIGYPVAVGIFWLLVSCAGQTARAHEAPATIASQPWSYGADCCHSAADVPYGDCAPIANKYVTTKPDGYHVDLPVGVHPKLLSKGYAGIIPYGQERRSQDFEYHICLSTDGGHRFCFFAAPGAI